MKLWKKISMLAVITILLGSGIFGGVVVYQTANYNLNQTVDGYRKQAEAAVHVLVKEMGDTAFQNYQEPTRKSFLQFALQKYASKDYILLKNGEILCNLTYYDLLERDTSRWTRNMTHVVQKEDGVHTLVMGKKFTVDGRDTYLLLMVKDISGLYEDIRQFIYFLIPVYIVIALMAVNIIFWVTKRMMRPLQELQRTAAAISEGDLKRRVRVRIPDEVGQVGVAFNKMADQVEAQMIEVESVAERRKQLLGSLTHELKTPMTSIIGYSDTLLHVKISESQQKKALEHINKECKRLERLAGKMMALVGMYDNDSIEMKVWPAKELLKRVDELERYALKEKGLRLIISNEMDTLYMDIDLMESLLVNLIDNAAKASSEGGTIDLIAEPGKFIVRDWGRGIEPEEIPKITEAFYMVDKSRSKKAGGIGLGLALCKKIAELHHAHLEIESWLDEGTSISVIFDQERGGENAC